MVNKSSSSKTSTDNSVSLNKTDQESGESPGSEEFVSSSKFSRKPDSVSYSNNSSQDPNPKIVHGKVVYDANKVILEESKDASMISALSKKESQKIKKNPGLNNKVNDSIDE